MPELVLAAGSSSVVGSVETDTGTASLAAGAWLGVSVEPDRWCLGRRGVDGARVPCPDRAQVAKGRQCARCQEADPWRWLHIVHRSQYPPDPALREHLMRPHWLYIATFAGGASKVGTAVEMRKHARLDEQGPVFAHWIGLAADGLEVRVWEDAVSRLAGIGQVVRPAAKVAGLSTRISLAELRSQHERTVARAQQVLAGIPEAVPIAEPWPNPRDPEALLVRTRRTYPGELDEGEHGFRVHECWGPVALVELDGDPDSNWAVDISALVGHRITYGDYRTPLPEIQDELF